MRVQYSKVQLDFRSSVHLKVSPCCCLLPVLAKHFFQTSVKEISQSLKVNLINVADAVMFS